MLNWVVGRLGRRFELRVGVDTERDDEVRQEASVVSPEVRKDDRLLFMKDGGVSCEVSETRRKKKTRIGFRGRRCRDGVPPSSKDFMR
jgi:hypothetical protein